MQSHCIFGACLVEVWTQMTTATPKRLIHAAKASHLFPRASFLAIADARSVAKSRGLTEPPSFDVLKRKRSISIGGVSARVNAHVLSRGSRCAQRPDTRLECLAAWKRSLLQQTVLVFDSDPQDALEGSCHIPPLVMLNVSMPGGLETFTLAADRVRLR